jgi:hypothetical protein
LQKRRGEQKIGDGKTSEKGRQKSKGEERRGEERG